MAYESSTDKTLQMNYYSLNNPNHKVSFREAVMQSIAPDNGLYFPETITPLPASFYETITALTNEEIAFRVIQPFVGNEIPETVLKQIIRDTVCFDFPVIPVADNIFALELYHGPTMAFKDVGARFMSRCLEYFNRENDCKTTVLVATSGDTGGAVANGFLGTKNVDVVIAYPGGKVSAIQELQLTTLGANISALEVDGTFDDCQAMVKKAFSDADLAGMHLTSANSINIARWLPQMFYFFFVYKTLKPYNKPIVLACPSGNFGNICAGMLSKRLGLPIARFVAATNANDTVPRFLATGTYTTNPTVATISNAMDVSSPSNFVRILALYQHDLKQLEQDFSSFSFTDAATLAAIKELYRQNGYLSEPHGAVGYLGLQQEMPQQPGSIGVFLETAHPIKFADIVASGLNIALPVPEQIERILNKEKVSHKIKSYQELKNYLMKK